LAALQITILHLIMMSSAHNIPLRILSIRALISFNYVTFSISLYMAYGSLQIFLFRFSQQSITV